MPPKTVLNQLKSELDPGVTVYAGGLACAAALTAGGLVAAGYGLGAFWAVALLALVAAFGERGVVHLTTTTVASISVLPTLFAAVLFGPLAGMVVGAASLIGEFGRPPYLSWVSYTSSRAVAGAITGLAASYTLTLTHSHVVGVVIATTLGAIIGEGLSVLFAAAAAQIRRTRRPSDLIRTLAPLIASSVPMYVPLVTLLVIAYRDLSPLTLPLFFVPALAAERLFVLYQDQRRLADELLKIGE